jgi:diguanylate cyclase (GGDEF)-like protein
MSDLIRLQNIAGTLEEAAHTEASAIRDFLLKGGSPVDLAPYESARTSEANLSGEFAAIDATFPTIHDKFRRVIEAAAAWRAGYVEPTLKIVAAGGLDEVRQRIPLDKGETRFRTVRAATGDLRHDVDVLTAATLARLADISRASFASLVIGVGMLLVGALVAAWFLTRWVARPLARLVSTAQQVEAGEGVEFPSGGDDEIGTLAGALERMRRTLSRQAREASVINRFTELTSFIESDGDVARATMQALEELTRPSDGAIHISNRSKDRAVPEASLGEITPGVVSLGTLAACPGVRRSSLYVTGDLADQLAVRCPVHVATSGALACIPLIALGEVVGTVHLRWDATGGLPLDLQGAVSRIAEHASLSVANRRLVAALQGQASTDPRTGLANSRAFDAALEEALRTRTTVEPLAVLMLDVDHFKAFNDRHGHPAGDEALRALAGVLRSCVREHDLAARYGGDEFAVMLPGLDATGGASVAERIRSRVESTIIQLAPGMTDKVTISIGVAAYPADAANRVELLSVADAALYAAKTRGRNRVVVAGGDDRAAQVEAPTPQLASDTSAA